MSTLSDAVDIQRLPILAVENPGKEELLALDKILRKLLEYCYQSDQQVVQVGHYIRNQDIEIDRLKKQVKKLRAVHN